MDCQRSRYDALWCVTHAADFPDGSAAACYAIRYPRPSPTVGTGPLRIRRAVWGGRSRVGRCPCECNRGGFCGGCGHAGCSGGVNVR